ncbi:MAG TPA: DUF998 domain-containing protein, partial [Candidatus Limnocylindria bacterium]
MATQAQLAGRPARAATRAGEGVLAQRVAGTFLLALAAGFLTVIMLAASMVEGYDYSAAAISDLGTIPETALLFNATLVVMGVLNVAGGYLYYLAHRRLWVLTIFVLASIGALGAGIFPLNVSDLHSIFALLAFVFFNLEAIAVAVLLHGTMRVLAAVAGLVGMVYVVIMVIGDSGNPAVFGAIGHGGAERMIAYPAMLWLIAFGGYLLGAP